MKSETRSPWRNGVLAFAMLLIIAAIALALGGGAVIEAQTATATVTGTRTVTPTAQATGLATVTATRALTGTPVATRTVTLTPTRVVTTAVTPTVTRTLTVVPGIITTGTLPTSRTIVVIGQGSVRAQPDQAQVNVGVETTASSVISATNEAAEIMDRIIAALRDEGIAMRDIQTSGFNIFIDRGQPMPGTTTPVSPTYHVNSTVRVIVRDLDNVGGVLEAAIDAGANQVFGVTFTISETTTIASQARENAMTSAVRSARDWATLAGMQIGPVISVSEVIGSVGGPPIPLAFGQGGGAAPEIAPGELEFTVQVQVTFSVR